MTNRHAIRDRVLPTALVVFFIGLLLALVWQMDSPRGADAWGHLFKAEYLARVMSAQGVGAYFTADWMPNWYLGDPFRTYYPPLTTQVLTPLLFLLGNTDLAYRVFLSLILIGFSVLTFWYLNRSWGAWPAFLGTVMAAGASYQMRTLFFEGNFPRALSLLALPAIAILTDRLLRPHKRRAPGMLALGIVWAWAILAHPQQAYIFAIGMALYLFLRLIFDPEVPIRRIFPVLGAIVLGAMIAGPWLLPAYSHGELANVPFLPQEKIPLFSASPMGFLPGFDLSDGTILFGIGGILLGLVAVSARPDPRRLAWFLAGLLGVIFSLGPAGVFFSLLPLNSQLLPERFLNFSAFAIPIAAAGALPLSWNSRWARVLLVVVLAGVDLIPSFSVLGGVPYPVEQAALTGVATRNQGRVALMTYPEPTALEVYFAGQNADLINGWALENTPHNAAIRRVLSAPQWGSEYLGALFSRWDVRTAVVSGGLEAEPARQFLTAADYRRTETLGRYEFWRLDQPAAPVQILPDKTMLVAGEGLTPFLSTFPFAEEASITQFQQIISAHLLDYPVLGFFRFAADPSGAQSVESTLENYLAAGGTAVVDLSGMEDQFGRTLDFLGVHVYRLSFQDRMNLQWADAGAGMPSVLDLTGLPEQGWSGATYDGLDETLAVVDRDGAQFPVFGYKDVGRGRVWFIGANLLYYALLTGDQPMQDYFQGKVLENAQAMLSAESGAITYPAVPIQDYLETAEGLSFQYALPEPVSALISYTWSPRWLGLIDGQQVTLEAREGLIRIALPAGAHFVEIRNQPFGTMWPVAGWGLSLLGVLLGGAAILWEARRKPAKTPRHNLEEAFQKPEGADGGGGFVPCAHCGFRLAVSHPPTPVTYPFSVSKCPICDAHMDDEGYVPGKDLSREEEARALNDWLSANGYDPRAVYTEWGFAMEEFFK